MLENLIKESEKIDLYDSPGHYEKKIHMDGQKQSIRKILSLFPNNDR